MMVWLVEVFIKGVEFVVDVVLGMLYVDMYGERCLFWVY